MVAVQLFQVRDKELHPTYVKARFTPTGDAAHATVL